MKSIKRIMAAIDSSAMADEVLKRALKIAKSKDADLIVIHTIDIPWFEMPVIESESDTIDIKDIKNKIENKVNELNKEANVNFITIVSTGDAANKIIYEAKREKTDLIVLGAHGKEEYKKSLLGTTAQKVTQRSHLPVLIVKNKVDNEYKNILIPTDTSDFSYKSALFAQELFEKDRLKLTYFYPRPSPLTMSFYNFNEEEQETYERKIKIFAKHDLENFNKSLNIKQSETVGYFTTVDVALVEYISRNHNDLIVIGSHGVKDIESFLFGSVASYVMKESPSDILVYVP